VELRVNTLGDAESRARYTRELTEYFGAHVDDLSPTAVDLLAKGNPLRILDSKHAADQVLAAWAPTILATATGEAKAWFGDIQAGLAAAGVPFVADNRIVRGLEYYTGTVWEFVTTALGSQNAVIAGGRYDNLVAELSRGKSVPVRSC
jgi:histidyl-tRNA synthetase